MAAFSPRGGAVSVKSRLRVVLACLTLLGGVTIGVPMRPSEIEDLMRQMNQPKIAHVLPKKDDDEGDVGAEQ